MIMRTQLTNTDPFRDLDRLAQHLTGSLTNGTFLSMDAYQDGDSLVAHFDVPGVAGESVDVNVERNVLTVEAKRDRTVAEGDSYVAAERPTGTFRRQLFLAESLDTDRAEAHVEDGVLTVRIPVSESAKPRKIEVASGERAAIGS